VSENDYDEPNDFQKMEEWLENYFLDPLTSFYDQTLFRIDLFETDQEWIVEAQMDDYQSSEITVNVEDKKLIIRGKRWVSSSNINEQIRTRTIEFPFPIKDQKITASFQNGILEIFISKLEKAFKKNRYITLP
jgi:HSP20 family molecular chaperone IbpA